MDAVLQALADESRRTMLEILRDHHATAGELADAVPIARPGVSRHLRVLREAGLGEGEQQAPMRLYPLRPEPPPPLRPRPAPHPARWGPPPRAPHTGGAPRRPEKKKTEKS